MPGFSTAMIPALRLDYVEVNRRVWWLKRRLDDAVRADIRFVVDGSEPLELTLDLRHRKAHASGGLLHQPGTAGNLPSGEAYIVPYEGEIPNDPTGSSGLFPIQIGDEVVVYQIEANKAVGVATDGELSRRALRDLEDEPASGNVAELGLGVLSDFGVQPIGEVLLDEKLGLHIAFGRSEHFGGQVGPDQFSHPSKVIHQDHVYLPELQPRVNPAEVSLSFEEGPDLLLMRDGHYDVDFSD
jgi:leucyl aminopeptidase (aminopeptidase T)